MLVQQTTKINVNVNRTVLVFTFHFANVNLVLYSGNEK